MIFASSNKHKFDELVSDLEGLASLSMPEHALSVEESGKTFADNALLKAKAYFDHLNTPVLSDDSGLIIHARPDLLGVQSARFKPELGYNDKCLHLVEILKNEENKEASFHCVLCLYISPKSVFFFEGQLNGQIALKLSGIGGFGYDPIFIPSGQTKTLAELVEWKKNNSHRAVALNQLKSFLSQQRVGQI